MVDFWNYLEKIKFMNIENKVSEKIEWLLILRKIVI